MKTIYKQLLTILFLSTLTLIGCSASDDINTTISQEEEEQEEIVTDPDSTDDTGMDTTDLLEALVLTDVSYGDNAQQVYDIYLPEGRDITKTKVIVLIHGGGWTGGDKSGMQQFVDYFLMNHPDHAIVNINYVLATIAGTPAFPNQYEDIEAVLNHLIEQQEELHILNEFGFLGTSAGAHLAMMYDYTYDTEDLVKFVIDIVGPADFTDPFYSDDPNFPFALTLLADASQFPAGTDLAMANSPALVANSSSSPTLLFYGNQDLLVPLTNGERLNNALNTINITHEFTVYDGGHGDDWSNADALDLRIKTDNYINTYLAID